MLIGIQMFIGELIAASDPDKKIITELFHL